MKISKFDSHVPRKILTGMVVHDGILESIYTRLGEEEKAPFNHRWMDLVARWCLEHYKKFKRAPRYAIVDRFARFAEKGNDTEGLELVEKFLDHLGRDFKGLSKDLNEDYILDLAAEHFNQVRLRRMSEEVELALEEGDLKRAQAAYKGYEPMDTYRSSFDKPFSKELIIETFRQLEQEEELINFRGDLRQFLSPHMKRGDFVSFVGPEKRGKSYWLNEIAFLALRSRRRVLYYAFGDMSKKEVLKRLYIRTARRPWREEELKIPAGIRFEDSGELRRVKFKPPRTFPAITKRGVWEASQKLLQLTASKELNLRLHVGGGSTVSAGEIERNVHQLVYHEGWIPDVIVIDYADLLDAEEGTSREDFRHRVNATWMVLRRIALDNHCLVVTATQAASSSYKATYVLGKQNFSEDKRKNAHVTGMLGLNQTDKEKEMGVYRLNWIVLRDGHWTEKQVVYTAGNLALSCPAIVSAFPYAKESE